MNLKQLAQGHPNKGSPEMVMRTMAQTSLWILQIFLSLKTLKHTALCKNIWLVLSTSEEPMLIWAAKEPGFSKKTE